MINPEIINKIGQQIAGLMPEQAKHTQREIEKNVHAILQGAFAKLDLVTRDEFEAQTAVLQRTREKLEQLEALVDELETKVQSDSQT